MSICHLDIVFYDMTVQIPLFYRVVFSYPFVIERHIIRIQMDGLLYVLQMYCVAYLFTLLMVSFSETDVINFNMVLFINAFLDSSCSLCLG